MHYCKKMNQLVKAEELRISSLVHSQKLQKRGPYEWFYDYSEFAEKKSWS